MRKHTTQFAIKSLIHRQTTAVNRLGVAAAAAANLHTSSRRLAAPPPPVPKHHLSNYTAPIMASDEDYMAFLDKANRDADEAHASAEASATTKTAFKTLDAGETPPAAIAAVCKDTFYVSDADEPFHPVSLQYTGENGLPDEGMFPFLPLPPASNPFFQPRACSLARQRSESQA